MSLALVEAPAQQQLEVAARLADLRRRLEHSTVDFADVIEVRDEAATLGAYVRSARLGLQLANQALEAKLRAERQAGRILLELLAAAPPATASLSRRRRFSPRGEDSNSDRQALPRQTLKRLGISAKDSSRYQLLARLDEHEFDARISATVAAGKLLSYLPFHRAAAQFRRKQAGRPSTTVARTLARALELLRDVHTIATAHELELARAIIALSEAWAVVLEPKPVRNPDTFLEREPTCLMCGRPQPPTKPPRCLVCNGPWYV